MLKQNEPVHLFQRENQKDKYVLNVKRKKVVAMARLRDFSSCEYAKVERWIIDEVVVKWDDSNDDGVLAGQHLTDTVWVGLLLPQNIPLIIMRGVKAGVRGGELSSAGFRLGQEQGSDEDTHRGESKDCAPENNPWQPTLLPSVN